MKNPRKRTGALEQLHVLADDGIHTMGLERITHLSASGAYTLISYLGQEDVLQAGKNLGRFEEALLPFGFYRIHKAHIVNLRHIGRYRSSKKGGEVELEDGTVLCVSRLRKQDFLEAFRKLASVTV